MSNWEYFCIALNVGFGLRLGWMIADEFARFVVNFFHGFVEGVAEKFRNDERDNGE